MPGYPRRLYTFELIPMERLLEITSKGGLALYKQRGKRYMQALGAKGGRNGRGAAKRREVHSKWAWWHK